MTDIRKCAQAVSNRATESGIVTDADDEMIALRQALAEPVSCQVILDDSAPSIDALIAEIDGLCFDESSGWYFWPESINPSSLKSITDKYRSVKMRFSCGETPESKWKSKKAKLSEWHKFFAILPRAVAVNDERLEYRWLETIERKGEYCNSWDSGYWIWEYRAKRSK